MMMTMTFKPNYEKAEKAAHQLLALNNVDELPIKVKKLANRFPNLKIKKYSWFARKWGISFQDVCELADSNEGCCWYTKTTNKYLILYNDRVENLGRIRWTIAHELGHFMLKHNELTNKAVLSRSSLTDKEYNLFEKEANCFAREILAPSAVIREIDIPNPQFISDIGNISWEAANNVMNFVKMGAQRGIKYPPNYPVLKLFSNFIYNTKHAKKCSKCNHKFSGTKFTFCPICGNREIVNNTLFIFRSDDVLNYSGYELNEISRVIVCPRCENKDIKGQYCSICDTHLFNRCTGLDDADEEVFTEVFKWHSYGGGCGELLDGNARYCHSCGSVSSFYADGLLEHWKNERQKTTLAGIRNEDLPF